jgi:hypothetical protein
MEEKMPKALEGFGRSKTGKITHNMKEWLESTVFNNNRTHVRLKLFKRQLLNKTMLHREMSHSTSKQCKTAGYIRVDR